MKTKTWSRIQTCRALVLALALSLSSCKSQKNEKAVAEAHTKKPLTVFSAEITCPVHEFTISRGAMQPLTITVKNTGSEPWIAGSGPMEVDVGYTWRDSTGTMVPGGTRSIPTRSVINPGESDSFKLNVQAIPVTGTYTLLISMVQEQVAFFSSEGATPLVLQVKVD